VVALAAGLLAVSGTQAQAANLEDHHPITYNMQGGQRGNVTPKWANDVPQLLAGHDVLALQEAGPLPPRDQTTAFLYQDSVRVSGYTVHHYLRNFGSDSRSLWAHVYFMETDPSGHRVNLAMVTLQEADDVWVTRPTFANTRPSFGIQLGNTVFNDVHAAANGGGDAPGMIENIAAGQGAAGLDYAVLGDFNRNPGTLEGQLPGGANLYRPGVPTHLNGGEYEYMVANRQVPLYTGHATRLRSADHLAVEFGVFPLQGAAGYAIGSYSAYGDGERVLDIDRESRDNGAHVNVYDNHDGANQHFNFVPVGGGVYTIRNQMTGKCLDLNNGSRAGAGDYVNEWDCQGQPTQNWVVRSWPDDPGAAEIQNSYTGLCLDVFGEGTGNGTWTDVWTCTGHDNQKWTLEYLDNSSVR
jgi:hypothetical protein